MGTPELVAAGRVSEEVEETTTHFNPHKMQFATTGRGFIPIRSSGIEKRTIRKRQTRYYVDMFTRYRHWRMAKESIPLREIDSLKRFASPGVYLTQSARKALQGQADIISFSKEKDYDRYLTWLIQLRYAKAQ